jgi:hypothetical protein
MVRASESFTYPKSCITTLSLDFFELFAADAAAVDTASEVVAATESLTRISPEAALLDADLRLADIDRVGMCIEDAFTT